MTAPAQPAQQAASRPVHRRPVLIALMTAMALAAMDTTIVATAIPQVVRDLGGFSLFSWVFSSYLLTQTVTIPVQGRLADQWGRKPVLIGGTIIFLAVQRVGDLRGHRPAARRLAGPVRLVAVDLPHQPAGRGGHDRAAPAVPAG